MNEYQRKLLGAFMARAKGALVGGAPESFAVHEQGGTQVRTVLADVGVDPRRAQDTVFAVLAAASIVTENLLEQLRVLTDDPDLQMKMDWAADTILTCVLFGCGIEVGPIPADADIAEYVEERARQRIAADALDDLEP